MNDKKKKYTKPEADVIDFKERDIITDSIAGENWDEYPDKETW